MNKYCIAGVLIVAVCATYAKQYYVSAMGKDSWPGTSEQPFRTIQHAADLMKAGDECIIRQGIYREAVTVKSDGSKAHPVIFCGFPNETVIISAADVLSGWEPVDHDLYRAKMDWDLGPSENQLYIDGVWAHEARWPNITEIDDRFGLDNYKKKDGTIDSYARRKAASQAGYGFKYYDKNIKEPFLYTATWKIKILFAEGGNHRGNSPTPGIFQCRTSSKSILHGKPRDYWKGTVYYDPGWWHGCGAAISQSHDDGDTVRFTLNLRKMRWAGEGIFVGHRDFIDRDGEWALDNGYVYMKMPHGKTPDKLTVSAKKRGILINANGRTGIHIQNIVFHGSGIQMFDAYDCVVDNSHFKYLSHYYVYDNNGAGVHAKDSAGFRGIILGGERNVFKNSSIEYSAGKGVIMRGKNNTVTNCFMRVTSYANSYASPIHGSQEGDEISYNTIEIAGRSAINGSHGGLITRNIFRDCMALSGDGGTMYTAGNYPINAEISYNWFDNILGRPSCYLYCDFAGYAYAVHHNVFFPSQSDRAYPLACQGGEFFNNTWACPTKAYRPFEHHHNNYFKTVDSWGLSINEIVATSDTEIDTAKWKFVDAAKGDFRLRKESPAVDAGIAIPGITAGAVGAPDLGAYEYGGENWVPGHTWGAMPQAGELWRKAQLPQAAIGTIAVPGSMNPGPVAYNSARNQLRFGKAYVGGTIRIIDMAGRTVLTELITARAINLALASGRYHYVLRKDSAEAKGKFVFIQ